MYPQTKERRLSPKHQSRVFFCFEGNPVLLGWGLGGRTACPICNVGGRKDARAGWPQQLHNRPRSPPTQGHLLLSRVRVAVHGSPAEFTVCLGLVEKAAKTKPTT